MPDQQQRDVQSQKPQVSPNLSGGINKEAAGKPDFKRPEGSDPKKTGVKDDDDDPESSCGTGSCG